MFDISFTNKAKRQLNKLDWNIQSRIINALERIRIRPRIYLKKLIGEPGYKLRVGDSRVIMDVYEKELIILVIKVGHRKNIYKR